MPSGPAVSPPSGPAVSAPNDSVFARLSAGVTPPIATQPVTLVIFGGGGDLAHRKLLPALYNLYVDGLLPPRLAVVGVGRGDMTDQAYRDFAKDGVAHFSRRPPDEAMWRTFADSLYFVTATFDDPQAFAPLGSRLDVIEHERGLPGNRIYYLAVPPSMFVTTVKNLAKAKFIGPLGEWPFSRLIVDFAHRFGRFEDQVNLILCQIVDAEEILFHE